MQRVVILVALAAALELVGCVPDPTGAPCADDSNCPADQHCNLSTLKCESGAGGSGGGSGGGTGGAGGGTGGGEGGGAGGGGGACGADTQNDPQNCGTCGNVCPAPVNASATCVAGACRRGPCALTFYDIDGATTFGCESTCSGRSCTTPGGTVNLSNDPIHERGLVGRSIVNGSSIRDIQTNANYTNIGSIGEATPNPGPGGGSETSNSNYRHRGGFGARSK